MIKNSDLIEEHRKLGARLQGFCIWERRLVPDLVLHGYAIDIVEQSNAVIILLQSQVPRAAVANARAAFEAALDMLLLTSREDEYDWFGALARASELIENEGLVSRRDAANALIGVESEPESYTPDQVVEHDGELWERGFPGGKALLQRAYEEVRKSRDRRRHWSGLSRRAIGAEIDKGRGDSAGLAEMIDTTYGLISVHAHGRPRLADRSTRVDELGRLVFVQKESHAGLARGVAYIACQFGLLALDRRSDFEPNGEPV